ncbi:MAG: S1C family serine protease [Verrucomicrobiota bacterium]
MQKFAKCGPPGAAAALALAFLLLTGCGGAPEADAPADSQAKASPAEPPGPESTSFESAPLGTADVVQSLRPFLVTVEAELPDNTASITNFLRNLNASDPTRAEQFATGIVVSAAGHVATTHRWVEAASGVRVRVGDLPPLPAQIMGRDRLTGIVLLKVDAQGLDPLPWPADGSGPVPGDACLALGSLAGREVVPTQGIVSSTNWGTATDTGVPGALILANVLSTPSHAGGGLFAPDGTFWGLLMPTAYFASEAISPLALALPAAEVRYVVDKLMVEGRVPRGYLGVQIRQFHAGIDADAGHTGEGGVLVVKISAGSPAEGAGLEVNDVIVAVNGAAINAVAELPQAIQRRRPGDQVVLDVVRKGQRLQPQIVLGDLP